MKLFLRLVISKSSNSELELNILLTYNALLLQVISDIFKPVVAYQILYILNFLINLFFNLRRHFLLNGGRCLILHSIVLVFCTVCELETIIPNKNLPGAQNVLIYICDGNSIIICTDATKTSLK